MQSYKVGLVGPSGAGKTCLSKRLITGEFAAEHVPTQQLAVRDFHILTNRGERLLHLHDFPEGLSAPVPALDAWVLVLTKETLGEYPRWRNFRPLAVAVNKYDLLGSELSPEQVSQLRVPPLPEGGIFCTSARSNYHYEKPLLHLLRHLEADEGLFFLEEAPITPMEVRS